MKLELNKEVAATEESIDMLVDELTSRDEMACKGHVVGAEGCFIN